MHLLSSYCSHKPLAPLLARQSHLAAEQHTLLKQSEVSAPQWRQQREDKIVAKSWWLVQLSNSNPTPDFCLPHRDGSSNRLGVQLTFLLGRILQIAGKNYTSGTKNRKQWDTEVLGLTCFPCAMQTRRRGDQHHVSTYKQQI